MTWETKELLIGPTPPFGPSVQQLHPLTKHGAQLGPRGQLSLNFCWFLTANEVQKKSLFQAKWQEGRWDPEQGHDWYVGKTRDWDTHITHHSCSLWSSTEYLRTFSTARPNRLFRIVRSSNSNIKEVATHKVLQWCITITWLASPTPCAHLPSVLPLDRARSTKRWSGEFRWCSNHWTTWSGSSS